MKKLMDYLPRVYEGSPEVAVIQESMEPEVLALYQAKSDLFAQFNVDTATWGLSEWEKSLALEVNAQRSMEERRARIRSKLRVQGVTTPEMLRNVAAAFSDGPVTLREYFSEYRFELGLVLSMDRPAGDLPALWKQVYEARPAHLGFLLWVTVPPAVIEEQNEGRLRRFGVRARAYERGNGMIRLDGVKRLDGAWKLDAALDFWPRLHRLTVSARDRHVFGSSAGVRYGAEVRTEENGRFSGFGIRGGALERLDGGLSGVGLGVEVHNYEGVRGAVTVNSMWRLDGAWNLDGVRKLDAGIVRSDL